MLSEVSSGVVAECCLVHQRSLDAFRNASILKYKPLQAMLHTRARFYQDSKSHAACQNARSQSQQVVYAETIASRS